MRNASGFCSYECESYAVRVARRVDDRAGGVGRLRRQVHAEGHVVELGDAVVQPLVRLVERAPADDGRMIAVAFQHLEPLRDEARGGLLVLPEGAAPRDAPVAELGPDQVAEPVGVIEEPLLEDLLVQARSVESGGHRQLDVAHERVVVGRRHEGVGPVPLVEHEPLEDRLAVQQDAVAADRHGAQAGVRLDVVDDLTVAGQPHAEAVQVRVLG
jgi:hypothetical protein